MSKRVVVLEKVPAAKDDEISQLIKDDSKLKKKITNLERPDLWRRIQHELRERLSARGATWRSGIDWRIGSCSH